jgi:hypothetical protein
MVFVMRKRREIVLASMSLSSTFFCVITTHAPLPRTAIAVSLSFTALNAYSTWYSRPSGEKIVMCRSKPAELTAANASGLPSKSSNEQPTNTTKGKQ